MSLLHKRPELVSRLAELPGFTDCPRPLLTELARHARQSAVPAGWVLIGEGTPGDACYILLSGEVRIVKGDTEIGTLGPGAVIGEVALAEHRLRTAMVVAVDRVELLNIGAADFSVLVGRHPALADRLLAGLARRQDN